MQGRYQSSISPPVTWLGNHWVAALKMFGIASSSVSTLLLAIVHESCSFTQQEMANVFHVLCFMPLFGNDPAEFLLWFAVHCNSSLERRIQFWMFMFNSYIILLKIIDNEKKTFSPALPGFATTFARTTTDVVSRIRYTLCLLLCSGLLWLYHDFKCDSRYVFAHVLNGCFISTVVIAWFRKYITTHRCPHRRIFQTRTPDIDRLI